MNHYQIDEAVRRWRQHPVLGPASRTLASLRDAANANSDGWAYWPKPARAGSRLIAFIEGDGLSWDEAHRGSRLDATPAKLKAALAPIKAFRTRSGIAFEIYEYGSPIQQEFSSI